MAIYSIPPVSIFKKENEEVIKLFLEKNKATICELSLPGTVLSEKNLGYQQLPSMQPNTKQSVDGFFYSLIKKNPL